MSASEYDLSTTYRTLRIDSVVALYCWYTGLYSVLPPCWMHSNAPGAMLPPRGFSESSSVFQRFGVWWCCGDNGSAASAGGGGGDLIDPDVEPGRDRSGGGGIGDGGAGADGAGGEVLAAGWWWWW